MNETGSGKGYIKAFTDVFLWAGYLLLPDFLTLFLIVCLFISLHSSIVALVLWNDPLRLFLLIELKTFV